MRRRVAALALLATTIVATAAARSWWDSSRSAPETVSLAVEAAQLPPPEQPAFRVGEPKLLSPGETRARFAPVVRRVEALADPDRAARPVAPLDRRTAEGTTNIVLVLAERMRPDGLWVRVRLPVLPNGRTGWVRRRALGGYEFVHTHLVIDRARFTATLLSDGRKIFTAPVGVGKSDSPTPSGKFYVRNRLSGFGDPFYGPVAFGTSARSAVLTDWPDGGFVGIHGTNEPGLIPGAISHGCVRLRNADILRLSRLMPVGTPLTIR
jgi:hypothetical protein